MNFRTQKKLKIMKKNSVKTKEFELFIKTNVIPILIFLFTIFVLLLINRPALIMNDEFITVNQLHQISIGHQALINECKYGCYENGTPLNYFVDKQNVLGYTLFLPIISYPALQFFSLFGDIFRLPIIICWSLIPIIISIIYGIAYPRNARIAGFPLIYLGAGISLFLLMINLYYYHPFPFTALDAPSESGAVVLTNTIIGAFICVVIYQTALIIWKSKKISLICTASILCCSSYLFWSGTAKDHILMTFMLILVTFFMICSIVMKKKKHQYIAFFFIGLLAWVRPEVGFSIFIGSLVFLAGNRIIESDRSTAWYHTLRNMLYSIIAMLCGCIPLFINNFITTGNIFLPPFYYYISKTSPVGTELTTTALQISQASGSTDISSLLQVPSLIVGYYLDISPIQTVTSLVSILFFPKSGNISLFAVTPLFLSGSIVLIGYMLYKRPKLPKDDIKILTLLILFILFFIAAYTKSFLGMSSSKGIVPDMRYFLPLCFLGGLIGFYPLATWGRTMILRIASLRYMAFLFGITIIITSLVAIQMPRASFMEYHFLYMAVTYAVLVLFIFLIFASLIGRCSPLWAGLIFLLMIALPFSWQLLMDLLYSLNHSKICGYPTWTPYLEYLFEKYHLFEFFNYN